WRVGSGDRNDSQRQYPARAHRPANKPVLPNHCLFRRPAEPTLSYRAGRQSLALRRSLILRGFGKPKPLMRSDSYGPAVAGNLAEATATKNPLQAKNNIKQLHKKRAVTPLRKAELG